MSLLFNLPDPPYLERMKKPKGKASPRPERSKMKPKTTKTSWEKFLYDTGGIKDQVRFGLISPRQMNRVISEWLRGQGKKFIAQQLTRERKRTGKALIKTLKGEWQVFEDAINEAGDFNNPTTRVAFEDESEMGGFESGILTAVRLVEANLKENE